MSKNNLNRIVKGVVFLVCFLFVTEASMAQVQEKEADLKAAFIYNFTKYIDWDTTVDENNFTIGVIGYSPVTASLNEIAKTYTIKNKRIVIRTFDRPEDIEYCNILFIPGNLPFPLESILGRVGRGVLTVSEETGFAKRGTAFNFVIIKDKLKFEANLNTIYSEGLKAGSQLLKLATIVD